MFRSMFIGSFLAAGLLAGTAGAQQAPPAVEQAVKRVYGPEGAQTKLLRSYEINGVKVNEFEVSNQFGTSYALITDDGNYLTSGIPHNPKIIAGPVSATIARLFANKPAQVKVFTVTNFLVDLQNQGAEGEAKEDRLTFDAVGQLKDIRNQGQLTHTENVMGKEKVTDQTDTNRMQTMADRFFGKGSTIQGIYREPNEKNFFVVQLTTPQGAKYSVETDGNNVFSRREDITENDLPQPVKSALNEMFGGKKVVRAFRRRYEYWQFPVTAGSQQLTMRIGTNGDVLDVINHTAQQQESAQQAKFGEGPGPTREGR